MDKLKLTVLVIEDSAEDRAIFRRSIKNLNQSSEIFQLSIIEKECLTDALYIEEFSSIDVVMLDLGLEDNEGLNGIQKIQEVSNAPVIVLTGQEDETLALEAIRSGAQDFLIKGHVSPSRLGHAILFAEQRYRQALEIDQLRIEQAKSIKMATLGEMASSIAHEINNPLSIIQACSGQVLHHLEKTEGDPNIEKLNKQITETVFRISKIVKGLKCYSHNDKTQAFEKVTFSKIIEDTIVLCNDKFNACGVSLSVKNQVETKILCNDVQISQVILNLLNNACDAAHDTDSKWVNIETQTDDKWLTITITDSGVIEDDLIKKKIFNPFFTTKPKGVGTGLGMGISKSIIDKHRGKLSLADNTENTTFIIELPILN